LPAAGLSNAGIRLSGSDGHEEGARVGTLVILKIVWLVSRESYDLVLNNIAANSATTADSNHSIRQVCTACHSAMVEVL